LYARFCKHRTKYDSRLCCRQAVSAVAIYANTSYSIRQCPSRSRNSLSHAPLPFCHHSPPTVPDLSEPKIRMVPLLSRRGGSPVRLGGQVRGARYSDPVEGNAATGMRRVQVHGSIFWCPPHLPRLPVQPTVSLSSLLSSRCPFRRESHWVLSEVLGVLVCAYDRESSQRASYEMLGVSFLHTSFNSLVDETVLGPRRSLTWLSPLSPSPTADTCLSIPSAATCRTTGSAS